MRTPRATCIRATTSIYRSTTDWLRQIRLTSASSSLSNVNAAIQFSNTLAFTAVNIVERIYLAMLPIGNIVCLLRWQPLGAFSS
jgi:hypothetical protein